MTRGSETIRGWHAHVYYDADSRPEAERLRAAIEERFDARVGRWHDRPVGPHPRGSYQIAFEPEHLGSLLPWLMLNRGALTVFVHPLTGDDIDDHDELALWLGPPELLNLEALRP